MINVQSDLDWKRDETSRILEGLGLPDKDPAPSVGQSGPGGDHAGPRPASPKSTDTIQSSDSTGDKQSGLVVNFYSFESEKLTAPSMIRFNHRLALLLFKDARQTKK